MNRQTHGQRVATGVARIRTPLSRAAARIGKGFRHFVTTDVETASFMAGSGQFYLDPPKENPKDVDQANAACNPKR